MTFSINGSDISDIIQVASAVGTALSVVIVGLIVYLMVRPSRQARLRRKAERHGLIAREADPADDEDLWRTVDRMESRLEVLERALADEVDRAAIGAGRTERTLAPAQDRESGRME
jgi:hypothetical protein